MDDFSPILAGFDHGSFIASTGSANAIDGMIPEYANPNFSQPDYSASMLSQSPCGGTPDGTRYSGYRNGDYHDAVTGCEAYDNRHDEDEPEVDGDEGAKHSRDKKREGKAKAKNPETKKPSKRRGTSLPDTTDAVPPSKLPKGHSKQKDKSLNSSGPPKKRGRKPIHAVDEAPRPDAEAEDNDHSTRAGPHKQLQLARNCVAAAKCRLKKKDEVSRLAGREREMEWENTNLAQFHEQLRTEVIELKCLVLQHAHCDCALIQTYIKEEARRVVERRAESVSSPRTTVSSQDYSTMPSQDFNTMPSSVSSQD